MLWQWVCLLMQMWIEDLISCLRLGQSTHQLLDGTFVKCTLVITILYKGGHGGPLKWWINDQHDQWVLIDLESYSSQCQIIHEDDQISSFQTRIIILDLESVDWCPEKKIFLLYEWLNRNKIILTFENKIYWQKFCVLYT